MTDAGKSTKESRSGAGTTFPFKKAFVVQFVDRAGATSTIFEGRMEHLESGRTARFGSRKALLGLLAEMLAQGSTDPRDETEPAETKPRSRRRGKAPP